MEIVEVEVPEDRGRICERVLRALPEWFGIESAVRDYIAAVRSMPFLVAQEEPGGAPAGFLALHQHNAATAEIHVMGVLPAHHRRGTGRRLVAAAEALARARGCRLLSVKTLSDSADYEPYARTRRFYLALGFLPVEEFKTLWGEANPCLLLVKPLGEPSAPPSPAPLR